MALLPPRDVALLEGVRRDDDLDAPLFGVGEDVIYGVAGRADVVDDDGLEVERVDGEADELLDGVAPDGVVNAALGVERHDRAVLQPVEGEPDALGSRCRDEWYDDRAELHREPDANDAGLEQAVALFEVAHVTELGVVRGEEEPHARVAAAVALEQIFPVVVDRVEQALVAVELLVVLPEPDGRGGVLRYWDGYPDSAM